MEKRCRPPQGYYKSLETAVLSRDRKKCNKRLDVLVIYQAEPIVGKKIVNGKPMFMVNWENFCTCENTWKPKAEAFENPEPDPVRVEEAKERIGLVFERGMKVPLQHEESIEIRHDVVHFLFPILPAQLQLAPTDISDQEEAGLSLYVERTINANGNRCRIVQLTFLLLLSKSPTFYCDGKKVS